MGQRSQIYIAFTDVDDKQHLVARYFQWNYGCRMVSRLRGLIEWANMSKEYLPEKFCLQENMRKLVTLSEVNFDFRDVTFSSDLIKEYAEQHFDPFTEAANNDGKAFIKISKDGSIKYALTNEFIGKVTTPTEYMKWGKYKKEAKDGSNYAKNAQYIEQFEQLTLEEVKAMCDLSLYEETLRFLHLQCSSENI